MDIFLATHEAKLSEAGEYGHLAFRAAQHGLPWLAGYYAARAATFALEAMGREQEATCEST